MSSRKNVTDAMIELGALAFTVNRLPTEVTCPALYHTIFLLQRLFFCYLFQKNFRNPVSECLDLPSFFRETSPLRFEGILITIAFM